MFFRQVGWSDAYDEPAEDDKSAMQFEKNAPEDSGAWLAMKTCQ
jgi:hypothetical protein